MPPFTNKISLTGLSVPAGTVYPVFFKNYSLPPGVHLRWSFDTELGFPRDGSGRPTNFIVERSDMPHIGGTTEECYNEVSHLPDSAYTPIKDIRVTFDPGAFLNRLNVFPYGGDLKTFYDDSIKQLAQQLSDLFMHEPPEPMNRQVLLTPNKGKVK